MAQSAILRGLFVGVAWLGSGLPTFAQTAIDGDSLRHGSQSIHLHGIDAPEGQQTCGGWPAGELAQEALAALVTGRRVECKGKRRVR
jgi:endonuclease YncB( thermonuclease family)